jgi:flavin reductase (DIM6/NTAB) family NADH-FMN oxidoreductase RutF
MGLHAFLAGANALCYVKNGHKYGMICAWAMMIDYDVIALLVGEQSATGKNLEVGMLVGVSALSKEQKAVALTLGNGHSDKIDKLANISYEIDEGAILISGARNNLVVRVEKLIKLNPENQDILIVAKFMKSKEDKSKEFIDAEEVFR